MVLFCKKIIFTESIINMALNSREKRMSEKIKKLRKKLRFENININALVYVTG